jgi:hypothetical protein
LANHTGATLINLTGRKFGKLTALRREGTRVGPKGATRPLWLVRCDCGQEKVVVGANLRSGQTTSCGCSQRKHGMYGTAEYTTWKSMFQRCFNPKTERFPSYGGRGITVCGRWMGDGGFQRFLEDMGRRPSPDHSLDRIDANGNYEPGNCRWATTVEQARNKRTSRVLVVNGESATIAGWAARAGLGASTVKERLRRGWTPEEALRPVPTSAER